MRIKSAQGRFLRLAVVLLVAASGGIEATSFLGLGHVFAGVMTSNLALLGMAAGRGEPLDVTAASLALGGFGAGTALAAWYTRASVTSATHWPRRVMVVLAAEAVLLALGASVWGFTGGRPGEAVRDVLQCGAALAMGAQSAAMVAAGKAAAPTTYLTGTLAAYIVKGIGTGSPGLWVPLRFAALVAGAALCAVMLDKARPWALLPSVVLVMCALAVAYLPEAHPPSAAGHSA
ncbi:DUF1275 family protein [Streptomyces sp. NPDC003273]|uniref:DUF1275 family protein n=1 Tax=Streptomyces sp. NPDC003273 TaxID=3364678 RepID=UPI003685D059